MKYSDCEWENRRMVIQNKMQRKERQNKFENQKYEAGEGIQKTKRQFLFVTPSSGVGAKAREAKRCRSVREGFSLHSFLSVGRTEIDTEGAKGKKLKKRSERIHQRVLHVHLACVWWSIKSTRDKEHKFSAQLLEL